MLKRCWLTLPLDFTMDWLMLTLIEIQLQLRLQFPEKTFFRSKLHRFVSCDVLVLYISIVITQILWYKSLSDLAPLSSISTVLSLLTKSGQDGCFSLIHYISRSTYCVTCLHWRGEDLREEFFFKSQSLDGRRPSGGGCWHRSRRRNFFLWRRWSQYRRGRHEAGPSRGTPADPRWGLSVRPAEQPRQQHRLPVRWVVRGKRHNIDKQCG